MAKSVKQQIDDIKTKYHTSINNNVVSKTEASKFYIDTDNADDLNNITKLLSKAVFKDIDYFNKTETEISSKLSEILIDYCRNGINHDQLLELLSIIFQYNNQVDDALNLIAHNSSDANSSYYTNYHNILYGILSVKNKLSIANKSYASKIYKNIANCYIFIKKSAEQTSEIYTNMNDDELNDYLINEYNNLNECELEYITALTYFYILRCSEYGLYRNSINVISSLPYYKNTTEQDPVEYCGAVNIEGSTLKLKSNEYPFTIDDAINILNGNDKCNDNETIRYTISTNTNTSIKPSYVQYNNNIVYIKKTNAKSNSDEYIPIKSNTIREYIKFDMYTENEMSNIDLSFYVLNSKYILSLVRNESQSNGANASDKTYYRNGNDLYIYSDGKYISLSEFDEDMSYQLELVPLETIVINTPYDINSNNSTININNTLNTFIDRSKNVIKNFDSSVNTDDPIVLNTSIYTKYAKSWNYLYELHEYETIKKKAIKIDYTIDLSAKSEESLIISDKSLSLIDNKKYPVIIECSNVELGNTPTDISIKSLIYNIIKSESNNSIPQSVIKLFEASETNTIDQILYNTKYLTFNILYKELNTTYRKAELSQNNELLISSYLINNNITISNSKFSSGILTYSDVKILTQDEFNELSDTYTNTYLARVARDNDIIKLQYGNTIGFGSEDEDQTKIEILLDCHSVVRDYYYDVLYNKAFILDKYYKLYSFMYIIGFTLDRYFSTEVEDLMDINKFTLSNCTEFLKSYGLSEIASTIITSAIPDKLSYARAIVATYSNLVRYKGSKEVIDVLSEMFNKAGSVFDVNISKYMIYEEYNGNLIKPKPNDENEPNDKNGNYILDNTSTNIKFIGVDYGTSNSINVINSNMEYAEKYDIFVENDPYWDSNVITEEDIKELGISPETTKYLGITLSSDIYTYHILNQYAYSLLDYMQNKLYSDISGTDGGTTMLDNIEFEIDGMGNITIVELFELLKLAVSVYIKLNDIKTGNSYSLGSGNNKKCYGINKNATISDFISYLKEHGFGGVAGVNEEDVNGKKEYSYTINNIDKNNIDKLIKSLFSNEILTNTGIITSPAGTLTTQYKYGKADFKYYSNYNYKNKLNEIITKNVVTEKILPIDNTQDNIKESILGLLDKEYVGTYGTSIKQLKSVFNDDGNLYTIDKILNGINPIIALNSKDNSENTNSTTKNIDIIKLLAYRQEALNNKGDYNTDILNSFSDQNTKNNVSLLYNSIIKGILEFPNKYLTGYFYSGQTAGTDKLHYNHDTKVFIDGLFYTYFTIPINEFSYVYNLDADNEAVDKFLQTVTGNITITSTTITNDKFNRIKDLINYVIDGYGTIDSNSISLTATSDDVTELYLSNILDRIYTFIDLFEAYFESFDYINSKYALSESTESTSEFMISLIKLFISYTCNIYKSETTNKYDNKFERFKTSYSFKDILDISITDTVYYDESVKYNISVNNNTTTNIDDTN